MPLISTDTNLVTIALGGLSALNCNDTTCSAPVSTVNSNYWLASRYYYYENNYRFFFGGFFVTKSGDVYRNQSWSPTGNGYMRSYYSSWRDNTSSSDNSKSLRPIVILNKNLSVTGSGTSADPYVLQ